MICGELFEHGVDLWEGEIGRDFQEQGNACVAGLGGAVFVDIDPAQEAVADQGATPVSGLRYMVLESDGVLPVIYWDVLGRMALIRLQPPTSDGGGGQSWQFVWNEGPDL